MPRLPATLVAALVLAAVGTVVFGFFPDLAVNMSGDVNLTGVVQAMLMGG